MEKHLLMMLGKINRNCKRGHFKFKTEMELKETDDFIAIVS